MTDTKLCDDLSVEINVAATAVSDIAQEIRRDVRELVRRVVVCGELLIRQRAALPHGTWQVWLREKCPDISESTARRYMRLARAQGMTASCQVRSLRHAYLLTGVLPQARRPRTPQPHAPRITFTRGLDEFRRWFHRRTDDRPLKLWSPRARMALRNELRWFKNLFDELSD